MRVLYESENLRLSATGKQNKKKAVVTFFSWAYEPSLSASGFYSKYLDSSEYYVFHIVSSGNDWFQYEDITECLQVLNSNTMEMEKIIAIGSSMGGYAVLNFSNAINCNYTIAISPQFSIAPDKAPWEKRWYKDSQRINFSQDEVVESLKINTQEHIIFFDPLNQDARHAEKLKYHKNCKLVEVPFVGHPASYFLVETNILKDLINVLLEKPGSYDIKKVLVEEVKLRRRKSLYYISSLICSLKSHHRKAKVRLIEYFDELCREKSYKGSLIDKVNGVRLSISMFKDLSEINSLIESNDFSFENLSASEVENIFKAISADLRNEFITQFYSVCERKTWLYKTFIPFFLRVCEHNISQLDGEIVVSIASSSSFPKNASERIGILFFRAAKYSHAILVFENLNNSTPNTSLYNRHLANIYLVQKEYSKAYIYSKNAFRKNQKLPNLILYLEACRRCNNTEEIARLQKYGATHYGDSEYFSRCR